jgi:hypothetical protein
MTDLITKPWIEEAVYEALLLQLPHKNNNNRPFSSATATTTNSNKNSGSRSGNSYSNPSNHRGGGGGGGGGVVVDPTTVEEVEAATATTTATNAAKIVQVLEVVPDASTADGFVAVMVFDGSVSVVAHPLSSEDGDERRRTTTAPQDCPLGRGSVVRIHNWRVSVQWPSSTSSSSSRYDRAAGAARGVAFGRQQLGSPQISLHIDGRAVVPLGGPGIAILRTPTPVEETVSVQRALLRVAQNQRQKQLQQPPSPSSTTDALVLPMGDLPDLFRPANRIVLEQLFDAAYKNDKRNLQRQQHVVVVEEEEQGLEMGENDAAAADNDERHERDRSTVEEEGVASQMETPYPQEPQDGDADPSELLPVGDVATLLWQRATTATSSTEISTAEPNNDQGAGRPPLVEIRQQQEGEDPDGNAVDDGDLHCPPPIRNAATTIPPLSTAEQLRQDENDEELLDDESSSEGDVDEEDKHNLGIGNMLMPETQEQELSPDKMDSDFMYSQPETQPECLHPDPAGTRPPTSPPPSARTMQKTDPTMHRTGSVHKQQQQRERDEGVDIQSSAASDKTDTVAPASNSQGDPTHAQFLESDDDHEQSQLETQSSILLDQSALSKRSNEEEPSQVETQATPSAFDRFQCAGRQEPIDGRNDSSTIIAPPNSNQEAATPDRNSEPGTAKRPVADLETDGPVPEEDDFIAQLLWARERRRARQKIAHPRCDKLQAWLLKD